MSPLLLAATVLATLVAVAHSYLGERYILIRLLRGDDLPKLLGGTTFTKRTLRFAWHLTSVAWLGFAALLASHQSPAPGASSLQLRIIAVTFAISGLITLLGSRARHLRGSSSSWLPSSRGSPLLELTLPTRS